MVIRIKEDLYDRSLIFIAFIAPVLLIALSKWQYSLNTWYMPLKDNPSVYFQKNLQEQINSLTDVTNNTGATMIFISDSNCVCTRATLTILNAALKESHRQDVKLRILDINSPIAKTQKWQRILKQIPATPTLLITDHKRLVYAGPVNAGSMCTTDVLKVLGLSVLESEPQKTVINWLEQGCYCPLKHM